MTTTESPTTGSTNDLGTTQGVDTYATLLERLAETSAVQVLPEQSARALRRGVGHSAENWESVWQDRLIAASGELCLRASSVWLSPAEIAGTLHPNAPAVTYRRTQGNESGWVLLTDRRWGRVFRAGLTDASGDWVSVSELAAALGVEADTRLPWLIVDPVQPVRTSTPHAPPTPPLQRLRQLIRPDSSDLWSVVMFAVVVGALTLATPVAVQQLVNSVALGGLLQPVVVLALLLFAGLSFSAVLSAIEAYVIEIVQRRVFVRVVDDIAQRLPRVRLDAFDRRHGPELVNRFFDVVTIQKVGATLLLDGVALLLQAVIGLLVLSFYHPLMLAFGVVLLLGIAVVVLVFGRRAIPTAIGESKAKYAVAGWLEELARHATDLKTIGASRFALERADDLAREYLIARKEHYRIVFRQLAGALGLQVIASSALLGLGGGLVIAGQLTLGQLVASELIVTAIVASFAKLGKHLESYYDLLAAVDKLGVLFDLPLESDTGSVFGNDQGPVALELKDVSFNYGDSHVLEEFNLRVEAGERVALLGESGSGKSTVLDLVFGLRMPTSGYITIDGSDLRELRLDSVRERIALVRGADIVEGTLEENVRMGRGYVSGPEIRASLAAVGMLDRALRLPQGLRTPLSTDGAPLSRGEATRVALARALAGKPRLILLDEPFGDLDERSRQLVFESLFAEDSPWSILLGSARPEDCSRCDRIVHVSAHPADGEDPSGPAGERI